MSGDAIRESLISPNVADRNGEASNVVDVINEISVAIHSYKRAYGEHSVDIADALRKIADGLHDVADAIRSHDDK